MDAQYRHMVAERAGIGATGAGSITILSSVSRYSSRDDNGGNWRYNHGASTAAPASSANRNNRAG